MTIRLYTDKQLNRLRGGETTLNTPTLPGKIRLYSDEQRTVFQKIGKRNRLIEEAWKIEEQTQQAIRKQTSFGSILKGTVGLGEPELGAIGKIGRRVREFGKSVVTHPGEVVKGAFETAVLKPVDFLQRTLQPDRLPERILTPEEREMSFEELRKKGISKYVSPLAKPKDKEAEQARQVGEFLGWLAPYSAISKVTGLIIGAITKAPKIIKLIPLISDTVGFLGTGQILHEEGSRLKQLRNDAIALGIFKSGALLYRGLKPNSTIKGEINTLLKDTKSLFQRPKKITVKNLDKIENNIIKINNLIKEETGLTTKELLQKEIIGEAPKKVRLYTDAQLTELKSIQGIKPKGKPSGVALSIEAKAVEKGLTKKFKDLAEFTPTTIKKQAKKMSKEMKDVENVKGMVRGDVPLPEGLSPATVIATMEAHAIKTKNGELMAEIARSPLVKQISEAAQKLSLTSQREKESAVVQIKSVMKTREKGVEQKLKFKTPEKIQRTMKKSLDKEIAKTKPTKHSWEQLMEDIKC